MAVHVTRAGVVLTVGIIVASLIVFSGLYAVKQRGEQARRDEAVKVAEEKLQAESNNETALNQRGTSGSTSNESENSQTSSDQSSSSGSVGSSSSSDSNTGSSSSSSNSSSSTTTTSELPQTGPANSLSAVIISGVVTYGVVAYGISRRRMAQQ